MMATGLKVHGPVGIVHELDVVKCCVVLFEQGQGLVIPLPNNGRGHVVAALAHPPLHPKLTLRYRIQAHVH